MIRGTDSNGNAVEIKPGQRFTLRKRPDLVYELAKDGSHRRVYHKPTGKQRRALRRMAKQQSR
jgi:hypothetical protein